MAGIDQPGGRSSVCSSGPDANSRRPGQQTPFGENHRMDTVGVGVGDAGQMAGLVVAVGDQGTGRPPATQSMPARRLAAQAPLLAAAGVGGVRAAFGVALEMLPLAGPVFAMVRCTVKGRRSTERPNSRQSCAPPERLGAAGNDDGARDTHQTLKQKTRMITRTMRVFAILGKCFRMLMAETVRFELTIQV